MDAIKVKLIGLSRGGGGNLQPDKTVTPTEQEQTVRADPGYDGLRQVTVEAIPDQYADVSGVDAGAGDVRVGKVIVGSDGETIIGTMPPQKPEEIGHATPTEQAQTVTPTAGSVFSAVEVEPIPSEYADVSSVDATAADVRTGKTIVDAQGDTVTGEMEPQKPEQVKTATPTTAPQSVTPDTGYALSRVDVGAIPSEYADVSDVTATAGTVLTGSDFVDASGTLVHGACDYDADTSDADATAGQIEAGATAYVGGAKVTGTMPVRTTDVEISDLSPVAIPAGSYDGTTSAKLSSAAAADVVASNIRQGAEILGVQGSYQGADTLGQYFANTLTSVEDNSATTLMARFFENKTALQTAEFDSLTTAGERAFYGCTGLVSAVFPALTETSQNMFRNCSSLASVDAQNVTLLGNDSFASSGLVSATFPSCTSIGGEAFVMCASLQSVSFPSATGLGGYAFRACTALTDVNLPIVAAVTERSAFSGCSSLPSISLPALGDTKDAFGSYYGMFGNCTSLKSADFGALTRLGAGCFSHDPIFDTLIIRTDSVCALANINAFDSTPFSSNGTGGTLYVQQAQIASYQSATNWSVILAYTNNQILPIEGSPYEVTT